MKIRKKVDYEFIKSRIERKLREKFNPEKWWRWNVERKIEKVYDGVILSYLDIKYHHILFEWVSVNTEFNIKQSDYSLDAVIIYLD